MATPFNTSINREKTSCVKYDLRENIFGSSSVIPMWVADMDIATPPFIIEAIRERLAHPILGYGFRNEAYLNSISSWLMQRHEWAVNNQWIAFCPGVVSGLNHAITALTNAADSIIIQPPVYHPFFHTVENNNRKLILNPLLENNGCYTMDFDNLEHHLRNGAKMLILSNPHNPVGRVWSKEELSTLGNLCVKYGTLIISDEIHSDLIFAPHKHIPLASISESIANITITFSSPSKTFNIAGLATAFAIISNAQLRDKYKKELEKTGAGMGNILGPVAVEAAYTEQGAAWLNELLSYL
ncbi:MAG: PatB family C-S lyase [Bacteroidales bacterium]|nr:PatB family C-S lyase [Bacteroidales bacterium]MBN2748886.1 PatB family C-S lyase [Bacteroidales bacterium]